MSRKAPKDLQTAPDHAGQDGARSQRSAKEAAMKLFSKTPGKDHPPKVMLQALEAADQDCVPGESEAPWPDNPEAASAWDAVSTPATTGLAGSREDVSSPTPEPTLRDIFTAVTSCNASVTALTSEIRGVKLELNLVRQDMQKLRDRTAALEDRVSNVEDEVAPLQRELRHVQSVSAGHAARLEDMENRQRRNNVRAVGIPEKIEGKNPVAFMEKWLLSTFGRDAFSSMFAIERAHRVPPRPPRPGEPPRPFLFKLLNFKDRDAALALARTKGDLMKMDNARISFYPDFSAELQRRRAKFTEVKKRLRRYEVTYAMLYPAKLRIAVNGETKFFDNPAQASDWLDRVEHTLPKASHPTV